MSEIRYNRLEDSYVIIAPERLHRPDYMAWTKEEQDPMTCPFCEGHEDKTPKEIYALRAPHSYANERGWYTRVVPNLYKAVQIEASYGVRQVGGHHIWEGFGAHEIIIDTPHHFTALSSWHHAHYVHWLSTMQARVADLQQDSRIAYITLFKNHGPFAGATQAHTHTQLIGLPIVPEAIAKKYERWEHYFKENGHVLLDTMIEEERQSKSRILLEVGAFTAFCPFASEYPFEVIVALKEVNTAFESIQKASLEELATLLEALFKAMEHVLGDFDFNMNIATGPQNRPQVYRFYMRIMPRIYRQGGFELSTGMMINPVEPEHSAQLLREALSRV